MPPWAYLYRNFVSQTDLTRMKECLGPLEDGIAARLQELGDRVDCQYERVAIQGAVNKILEIKTARLGFTS
jgi:hypothetical protein